MRTDRPQAKRKNWPGRLEALQTHIHYRFAEIKALEEALSHSTYYKHKKIKLSIDVQQRLEFLGDSILEAVISTELFQVFPSADEGQLSQMRSHLVNKEQLVQQAKAIGLDEVLRFHLAAAKDKASDNLLEDAFEAVIGAIFLDGGFEACQRSIKKLFAPVIKSFEQGIIPHHAKSSLQRYSQSKYQKNPEYQLVQRTGPAHRSHYYVEVLLRGEKLAVGEGSSKKKAEENAAEKALKGLKKAELRKLYGTP